ncbi:DUF975 family protein [Lactiplantibacillus sp. WILCCON 0030]|uniref:DUF975 family protein n=1 Tax=Lactiplantibacillus brownii TaxID=3069269 RepID=A0ABU1A9S7_9LACO|nr:DUF975 family protein [Lactiplantibacillus brownii]MDQ7937365.1 DUF975 family protein [Lactiplantibacillus brownii]
MKTRGELKQEVKQLFKGRWKQAILLCIVVSLLSMFGVMAQYSQRASGQTNTKADYSWINRMADFSWRDLSVMAGVVIVVLLIQLAFYLIVKIFMTGTAYSMLDWVRNPEREIHPVSDSTIGFTKQYAWQIVGLQILQSIMVFLWGLLLVVPGIIKAFAYSQTFYVYKDLLAATPAGHARPRLLEAITRSRQLMKGHKFEYFVLQLSFIGWAIASALTLGIGQLWLTPYRYGVFANYYDNLVALAAEKA